MYNFAQNLNCYHLNTFYKVFSVNYYTAMSQPPEVKSITRKVISENIRHLSNIMQVLIFRTSDVTPHQEEIVMPQKS